MLKKLFRFCRQRNKVEETFFQAIQKINEQCWMLRKVRVISWHGGLCLYILSQIYSVARFEITQATV